VLFLVFDAKTAVCTFIIFLHIASLLGLLFLSLGLVQNLILIHEARRMSSGFFCSFICNQKAIHMCFEALTSIRQLRRTFKSS
jgi:hypothetical protein